MPKANGAAIEAAAIPQPLYTERPDVFALIEECKIDPAEAGIGETPVVLSVKFGRPRSQDWVRCHPDPARVYLFHGIKDQTDNKLYVVTPAILSLVGSQARTFRARQAITPERELYLWPAPAEGRLESDIAHLNAQQMALSRWVKIVWDRKTFRAVEPEGDLGEPQWPDLPFNEVLAMGLTPHLLDREDHPFVKRLLGRV